MALWRIRRRSKIATGFGHDNSVSNPPFFQLPGSLPGRAGSQPDGAARGTLPEPRADYAEPRYVGDAGPPITPPSTTTPGPNA